MQYQHDKILFATSEMFPYVKTGGLADVSAGLPQALHKKGVDIRVILPAYLDTKRCFKRLKEVASFDKPYKGRILEAQVGRNHVPLWLVDIPILFERVGGPYAASNGLDWPDNAERFAAFSRIISQLALDQFELDWQPDIVHCNDWQTALVPALLDAHQKRPRTLFTIHNLAYQGLYDYDTFKRLQLDEQLWSPEAMEFYGNFCFIKGGLIFADKINTVSPSYAKEITTGEFGFGLDGLLRYRQKDLSGIVNGVDDSLWNPSKDRYIEQNYSRNTVARKSVNKQKLQGLFGLPEKEDVPLLATVGRIVEQKGYDLILDALPTIMQEDVQLVILGSGNQYLESRLLQAMQKYRGKLSVKLGYNEALAHQLEAGADIFLMPSRFEPCGLNQIYSQRYGTVPIVHHTGGLIDTVVDTTELSLERGEATGFHFYQATPDALAKAVQRALFLYRRPRKWRQIVKQGMQCDFSWPHAADEYLRLYQRLHKKPDNKIPQISV